MEKTLLKQIEEQQKELNNAIAERDMYLERLNNRIDRGVENEATVNELWVFINRAINEKGDLLVVAYDLLVKVIEGSVSTLEIGEGEDDRYAIIESILDELPFELVQYFADRHPHLMRPEEEPVDEEPEILPENLS